MNMLITWLIKLNGGMPIWFRFEGDKGKKDISFTVYGHYKPLVDEFVVDWDKKEIYKQIRK